MNISNFNDGPAQKLADPSKQKPLNTEASAFQDAQVEWTEQGPAGDAGVTAAVEGAVPHDHRDVRRRWVGLHHRCDADGQHHVAARYDILSV